MLVAVACDEGAALDRAAVPHQAIGAVFGGLEEAKADRKPAARPRSGESGPVVLGRWAAGQGFFTVSPSGNRVSFDQPSIPKEENK